VPLAHVIGDKAEAAYRPSDGLEKRRKLMEAWAAFCEESDVASNADGRIRDEYASVPWAPGATKTASVVRSATLVLVIMMGLS
jgi:hypothetical protein